MSVNPPLNEDGQPALLAGETWLMVASNVSLEVESGRGYPGEGGCFYDRGGRCLISRQRVVYLAGTARPGAVEDPGRPPHRRQLFAFELPVLSLLRARLDKPLLSAPWSPGKGQKIVGGLEHVPGGGLLGEGRFQLKFKGKGDGAAFFRHLVDCVLALHRAPPPGAAPPPAPAPTLTATLPASASASSSSIAYIDPDNPGQGFFVVHNPEPDGELS